MKYYIQYHKGNEFGFPFTDNGNIEDILFEEKIRNDLVFYTSKKMVKKALGANCFLIVGHGKKGKMNFYLWSYILIESVEFLNGRFNINGTGFNFKKPILLNDLENFILFKNKLKNFRDGFTQINNTDFLETLIKLRDIYNPHKILDDEESKINKIKELSKHDRLNLIKSYNVKPEKTITTTVTFKRNPYVIVEILLRANGKCERCKNEAPFFRDKDGSQYLEVHHIVPLAENGDDTIENAIALCPNCHRHAHYGKSSY